MANKTLLDHHLEHLEQLGFKSVVINVAYLGEQIIEHIQRRCPTGLHVSLSDERATGPLETAGGIIKALPLIGSDPFLVINGDVWHNTDLVGFCARACRALQQAKAYLGMVTNPAHNPTGDFALSANGQLEVRGASMLTFSGIGVYSKSLFTALPQGQLKLAPLLLEQIQHHAVMGEQLDADWFDIGTPERLSNLEAWLAGSA